MMRMVRKWPYVISPFNVNCKKWHKFPKIFVNKTSDPKLWTKSYAWQKVNELVQYSGSDMDTYYTRASENSSADLELYRVV